MKLKQLENVLINIVMSQVTMTIISIESLSVICSHLHTNSSDFDSVLLP